MQKNKVMREQTVLIGVGCSHTQGSAFIVGPETPDEHGTYELASPQLKEKYKRDRVDEEFITNLTWIGKLNKYLKYDKVLNFGLGGRGIEPNIRSLRSYLYKVKDLSNHLIIIMSAPPSRKEIIHLNTKIGYTGEFFTKKSRHEKGKTISRYELDGNLVSSMDDLKNPFRVLKKRYFKYYYHEEYNAYKFLMDLYYLQDYLELKGAKVFISLSNGGYRTLNQIRDYYANLIENSNNWYKFFTPSHSFNTKLQTPPNIEEIITELNWLLTEEFKNTKNITLHEVGLVKDDHHLSEYGSELLAKSFYDGLKKFNFNE
jgi:hypothetical protein